MALPGETVGLRGATCKCGKDLRLGKFSSNAGFYLGYLCPRCGPYSRETIYMDERTADVLLDMTHLIFKYLR